VTFTYEREVFLPMALTVPEDFDAEVFQFRAWQQRQTA